MFQHQKNHFSQLFIFKMEANAVKRPKAKNRMRKINRREKGK
jgi:hypothetical protein